MNLQEETIEVGCTAYTQAEFAEAFPSTISHREFEVRYNSHDEEWDCFLVTVTLGGVRTNKWMCSYETEADAAAWLGENSRVDFSL